MASGQQSEFNVDHADAESVSENHDPDGLSGTPVFVDTSGRRRRQIRVVACGVGLACASYTVAIGLSLLGVPVAPQELLPKAIAAVVPEADGDTDPSRAHAAPAATAARGQSPGPGTRHTGQDTQGPAPLPQDNGGAAGGRDTGITDPMPAVAAAPNVPPATPSPVPSAPPSSPPPSAAPSSAAPSTPATQPQTGTSSASNQLMPTAPAPVLPTTAPAATATQPITAPATSGPAARPVPAPPAPSGSAAAQLLSL